MKINSLKLINFRNYSKLNLEFDNKLNIIYGNNGVGKTNLVEAIYTLSLTKSFRTNNDRNLIKNDELSTKIEGVIKKDGESNYQVIINKSEKKVKIDNNIQAKFSDYISNIYVILLEPDEQILFEEEPSMRRKLLNIEISQLNKEYVVLLNNYNKTLKQRNFYLRELYINGNRSVDYLNIITKKLVEYGLEINKLRKMFIDKINEHINEYYYKIFDSGELFVKYNSDYNNKSEDELLKHYEKYYDKEIVNGKTMFGIHHDDLIFMLDNKNIVEWGSNGQRKNAILSFKLAEIDVFNELKGDYPILILDDIFSALDNQKVKNILKSINENVQTFITTTELNRISRKIIKEAKLFKVKDGVIEEG